MLSTKLMKQFTVKTIHGFKETFSIDDTTSFEEFKVIVNYAIGSETKILKFISIGKIINAQNFGDIPDGSIIICMTSSTNTSSSSNSNASSTIETKGEPRLESKPAQSAQSAQPAQSTQSMEPTYSYKQVKASMIVFLDFIRNNPQVKNLYHNDYPALVREIIHNPDLNMIITNILSQSGQILEAMEKGGNMTVNINAGGHGKVEEIELDQQNRDDIEDIIAMGFDPTLVVKTYVETNKNKELTVQTLLELNDVV